MGEDKTGKLKTGPKGPRTVLDESAIVDMLAIGCTQEDIAYVLGTSVDTLSRNYAEVMKRGYHEARHKSKKMLMRHAEKGHAVAMKYVITNVLHEKTEELPSAINEVKVVIEDYRSNKDEKK